MKKESNFEEVVRLTITEGENRQRLNYVLGSILESYDKSLREDRKNSLQAREDAYRIYRKSTLAKII